MIYLITGAPNCGKTILSEILSKKLDVSWLSTEAIELIISTQTKNSELEKLLPYSFMSQRAQDNNDLMYETYPVAEIVKAYIQQTKNIEPALKTLIDYQLTTGRDYIIAGHHIHPKLIHKIINDYGIKNIKPLVITRLNKSQIINFTLKHADENYWFIKTAKNSTTHDKMAEMIKQYSKFFKQEAKKYQLNTINVDDNFLTTINLAVSKLIKPH